MPHHRNDPIRRTGRFDPVRRRQAEQECEDLRAELREIDASLASIGARRHSLAKKLAACRDELWPRDRRRFGRRPGPDGAVQLPTLPEQPTKLWGRRLRAICLGILKVTGTSTLTELHVLLHRRGYEVDSDNAVKALADALGYETDNGRASRVGRGIYEALPGTGATPALQDLDEAC